MAISNGVIGLFLEGKKVVGVRAAAVTVPPVAASAPTKAEYDALRNAFADLVGKLAAHGLIET